MSTRLSRHSAAAALIASTLSLVFAPASAADKVKVGFVSTLSGPSSALGVDIRDGFLLAVKLNGSKLGGLPAEVLVSDDQFKPDVAKQLFEKNIKRDKVDFMTGVVFSNIMLAALPEALDSKTIYISPNAAPSSMAGKAGDGEQTEWVGSPSIFAEDKLMMEIRKGRVSHPNAWSQAPMWETNHIVSHVALESVAPTAIEVRSRFHMMELRRDAVRHFGGSYRHTLVRDDTGALRIKLQRADLFNAQAPFDYVLQIWV